MFAIITQLQLPQSCRHSNGAGRPSLAAKWQEGARALWAGRGGVARAPGAVPPAPFVGSPPPATPSPEARGKGALSGHREVGAAQGRPQQMPVPAAGPWGKGEQVSGGLGVLGVPVAQGLTWDWCCHLDAHSTPQDPWVSPPTVSSLGPSQEGCL